MSRPPKPPVHHLLGLIGVRTFASLARRYEVDPGFRLKALGLLLSCGLAVPLRWLDLLMSSRAVARTPLAHAPLFIVGHWRSGTTHLHNLLSCDPQFGCVRGIHCVAARSFLGARRLVRSLLGPLLPPLRPMDGMKFGFDLPQEEEFALARIAPMSQYHAFCFPRRMREIFDRWVTFETASEADRSAWKETYSWMLRRVSIDEGGKPLCLKCPPNSARLRVLCDLFPEARFIHIYRNPYVVCQSNLNMWQTMIAEGTLHRVDGLPLEENLFYFYRRLLERFFEDAASLPPGRLVHVRFEDLESAPMGEIERVYDSLGLRGFGAAAGHVNHYLECNRQYQKNSSTFSEELLRRVESECGFALARWNYSRPKVAACERPRTALEDVR